MDLWSERERCEDVDRPGEKYVPRREQLVVAIASDSAELLPSLAVINSTATHSLNASIVAITTRKRALLELARRLRRALPRTLKLRVCDGLEDVLKRRPALAALRGLTTRNPNATALRVRRPELLSPFNFAAFYLPHCMLLAEEILYLDTDVVVRSDVVSQALMLKPKNKPIAAVEDCSQRLGKYVNFQLLRKLLLKDPTYRGGQTTPQPFSKQKLRVNMGIERFGLFTDEETTTENPIVDEETCVFNRGVVLFETKRWRDLGLSATIEALIFSYVKSKAKLWRGGVSQPPFLVALAGRYKKLPLEWNVRGLGRVDLGKNELANLETVIYRKRATSSNRSFAMLKANLSRIAHFDKFSPFVAPLAHRATVLHFTGEIKPWRIPRSAAKSPDKYGVAVTSSGHVAGECLLQRSFPQRSTNYSSPTHFFSSGCFAKLPLCAVQRDRVESCASVWHAYVNDDARRLALAVVPRAATEDDADESSSSSDTTVTWPPQQRRHHRRYSRTGGRRQGVPVTTTTGTAMLLRT